MLGTICILNLLDFDASFEIKANFCSRKQIFACKGPTLILHSTQLRPEVTKQNSGRSRFSVHTVLKNLMFISKAVIVNTLTQQKLLFNFPTEKCERPNIFVDFLIFCILSTKKIMSDNLISVISYFINLSTCKRCFINRLL